MATKKDGIDLQFSIATKEANENLRQLSSQVTTLNKALGVTDETMKGTGKSVETYQSKISDLNKQKELLIKKQEENQRMLKLAIESYGDASDEARKWTNEILDNEKKLVKVNNAIDKTEDQMQEYIKTNKDAENSNEKLNKSLDTVKDGFTVFKGVMADLISNGIQKLSSAIHGSLDSAISRVDTINSYKKTMENLGYSTEKVTDTTNKLKKGIEGLPTTLPNIMSMQQQYTALSGNIDEATKLTIALNNATLAGGQGQQVANSAMEQWYQIIAKGKPDAQSWQIINSAMPAQMNQIAESVLGAGKSSQDLFESWQKGTTTTQEVKDALIELNSKGGGKLASFEKQAQDSTGGIETSMANLKTAVSNSLANIIESIGQSNISSVFDSLKGVVKKVGDSLADMVKKVDWKKFGKLVSDALGVVLKAFEFIIKHQNVVISAIKGVLTAMAVKKVAEFGDKMKNTVSCVVDSIKQWGLHKTAIEVDTVATGLATTATKGLNTAMSSNVIGVVVTLLGGLVTALDLFSDSADNSTSKTKELNEELDDYNNSMKELEDSRKEYLSKTTAELDHYDDLYRELQLIVDENGRIKKGYEDRAQYITSTLSEALGIEIEIVDGQVQKYGELGNAITDVIEKKKMEALLNAHEDEYNKAISDKTNREEKYAEAIENKNKAQSDYNDTLKKYSDALGMTTEETEKLLESIRNGETKYVYPYNKALEDCGVTAKGAGKELNKLRNELDEASENLEKEGQALSDNQEKIYNYTTATGLLAENNYEDMKKIYDDTIHFTGKTIEDNRKIYETNISNNQAYLDRLIANQDKYSEDFINSEKDRIAKQEEQWQIELEKANNNLENQNTVKTNKVIEGINKQLEAIDSKKYEFRDAGNGNMQLYVDGVAEGEPVAEEEAINLSNVVTSNLKNCKWGAKEAGNYLIEGVQLGINEKKGSLFSNVISLAQNVLKSLKLGLDEHSPSKTSRLYGQYLLQGLNLGIKDESKDSLKTISDFGNQVLSTFGSTVNNVSSSFDSMKLDNIITPQFTQEVTEKATTIRETRPIILNIDTFNNNTDRDIESLSNELAFYVRQKEVTG